MKMEVDQSTIGNIPLNEPQVFNPVTAEEYDITDGDWIWIESSVGTIKVQAKIHPGIMPSVVSIPFGLGHTSYGRYAEGHGANPNSILNNLYDKITGKPALQATKVKISLATQFGESL